MVGQTPVYAGFTNTLGNTDDKNQCRKHHHTSSDIEGKIFVDPVNGDGCRRVSQKEQANDADPENPPGNGITTPFIGEPSTQGPDDTGRQHEKQGDQRRLLEAQPKF